MAALRRSVQLHRVYSACLLKPRCISSTAVVQGEWNKDWMPKPYPKTEEERKAAAKEYGLLPEDYTPLPDDGNGHGTYPQFPLIGDEQKDPYENWDDPVLRRNFGDPLHIYHESLVADKSDPAKYYRTKPWKMICTFVTIYMFILISWIYSTQYGMLNSKYSDWYPYAKVGRYIRGRVLPSGERQIHYTFEPAE